MARPSFTDRVSNRSAIAGVLLGTIYADAIAAAGLVRDDLEVIQSTGEKAREHDRLQREDLGAQQYVLQQLAQAQQTVDSESEDLRIRVPAVIVDLGKNESTAAQASWLASASYERFRTRLIPPSPAELAESPEAKPRREVVVRTDRMGRCQAISQFAESILSPERAPIVDALTVRGFPRARVEALAAATKEVVEKLGAYQTKTASPHTELESQAVAAQKTRWAACRRMIARVVEAKPELVPYWSGC